MIARPLDHGLRGLLRCDESGARHGAWGIGGPVARLYEPADLTDLQRFLGTLPPTEPLQWLGGGSNLLVREGGYPGTVLAPRRAFDQIDWVDQTALRVGSGVRLPRLARLCAQHGLRGGEAFAHWPHTVGGALQLSIMRERQSLWPLVEALEVIGRDGHCRRLSLAALRRRGQLQDAWLVGVQLRFARRLPDRGPEGPLASLAASAAPRRAACRGPLFRAAHGRRVHDLVRQTGLSGTRCGDAALAADDGNFLHLGANASVQDVERLLVRVRDWVRSELGVRLEPFVQFVGRQP